MRSIAAFALFAALAAPACAWFDTGHMVVAEVALRNLQPEVRKEAMRLLEAAGLDARTNDFRTAACWADDHKTQQDGPWHYINYYFRADGRPPKGKPLKENVVWAIGHFREVLSNRQRSDAERGKALVWLLHFVGDIHQPMHSVARETAETPNGDRGGNDFKLISPSFIQPPVTNLHALWDSGAGLFSSVVRPLNDVGQRTIARLADRAADALSGRLAGNYVAVQDPEAWAKESFELAQEYAYAMEPNTQPTSFYLAKCEAVSLWRVGLAGRRLSDLINQSLR